MHISFSGDLCPNGSYEQCFVEGDVDKLMPELIAELEKSDLHITNLELPISYGGEPILKCGPNFRSSPKIITKSGLKA